MIKSIRKIFLIFVFWGMQSVCGALPLQNNALYMHSFERNSNLYTVDSNNGFATLVGNLGISCTDITFAGNSLFGISFTEFFSLDPTTGSVTGLIAHGYNDLNALTADTPQRLYAAGNLINFKNNKNVGGKFVRIKFNNKTKTWTTKLIGYYGSGITSAGDLAFFRKTLYATVNTAKSANTWLAKINPKTGKAKLVGDIGFPNVWGLAVKDKKMFAAAADGGLLQINLKNGSGIMLGDNGVAQGGLAKSP